MPKAGYQGDYIIEIAEAVDKRFGAGLAHHKETILEKIPSDLDPVEEKEKIIDAFINAAIELLGENNFNEVREMALSRILEDI